MFCCHVFNPRPSIYFRRIGLQKFIRMVTIRISNVGRTSNSRQRERLWWKMYQDSSGYMASSACKDKAWVI